MENVAQNENLSIADGGNVKREKVRTISISVIDDAKNHPFYVKDDKTTLF